MNPGQFSGADGGFAALRQFARRRPTAEHCELCGAEVVPEHAHLVDLARRKLLCACDPCAVLFSGQDGPKYKRVPRRVTVLADFRMTDAQWDGLMIPINMAFFFKNSAEEKISVFYPSPAGATESLLALETWDEIVRENPGLGHMDSDVEALLVNRVGYARGATPAEYYLLPIDECYKLVGIIRMHWRGLSGGSKVWQELGHFFTGLQSRVRVGEESHA
ncbi:MAG TPA: DUF5947 family protein [Terriglobales bacterium]|nr:DUF5947 family protein [Terriglobales bacterium]